MTLPYRSESAPHTGLEQSMKSWSGIWSINRFQSMHICSLLSICIGQSMNNRWSRSSNLCLSITIDWRWNFDAIQLIDFKRFSMIIDNRKAVLSNWLISIYLQWLLTINENNKLQKLLHQLFTDYQYQSIDCYHWFSLINNFIDCPGPTHITSGFCPRQIILRHCCLLG